MTLLHNSIYCSYTFFHFFKRQIYSQRKLLSIVPMLKREVSKKLLEPWLLLVKIQRLICWRSNTLMFLASCWNTKIPRWNFYLRMLLFFLLRKDWVCQRLCLRVGFNLVKRGLFFVLRWYIYICAVFYSETKTRHI